MNLEIFCDVSTPTQNSEISSVRLHELQRTAVGVGDPFNFWLDPDPCDYNLDMNSALRFIEIWAQP